MAKNSCWATQEERAERLLLGSLQSSTLDSNRPSKCAKKTIPEEVFLSELPLGKKGEGQRFFLSLQFLNNQLKINNLKGTFWGGKTLVPSGLRTPCSIKIIEDSEVLLFMWVIAIENL